MRRMRRCLFAYRGSFFFKASVVFLQILFMIPPYLILKGAGPMVSPLAVGVPPCRTPVDSLE